MADTRTLTVKITGDTSSLEKALKSVTSTSDKTADSVSNFTGKIAAGNIIANVATQAFSSVKSQLSSIFDEADKKSQTFAQLGAVIKSTGDVSGVTANMANSLADSIQRNTAVDDDAARTAENMLLTFTSIGRTVFPEATQAVLDMATAMNGGATPSAQQLSDTAIQVGKALQDPIVGVTALRRVGVQLSETQQEQVQHFMAVNDQASAQKLILAELAREFGGSAASAADTLSGSEKQLKNSIDDTKASFGLLLEGGIQPLVQGTTNFIGTNQESIVSFGGAALAAIGVGAALYGVVEAIKAFQLESLIAAATNPLLLAMTAIGAIVGVTVYNAMDKAQKKMADLEKTSTDTSKTLGDGLSSGANKASQSVSDLADKLSQIDQQITQANGDFQEQLAEMVKGHQDKVTSLKGQLDQENSDFDNSQADQKQSFEDNQQSQTDAHQKKVDSIQKQINQQVAMGAHADQQQLADLRAQLAQENQDYDAQVAKNQTKYDADTANAKAAHDKKISDLQAQLDQENALLTKHAADVASVQSVTLLDEIDKLKQSHDRQIASFEDEKNAAIKSSGEATSGVSDNWNNMANSLTSSSSGAGSAIGNAMGNAMKDALTGALQDTGKGLMHFFDQVGKALPHLFDGSHSLSEVWDAAGKAANGDFSHRATGGSVEAGQPYVWNENGMEMMVSSKDGYVLNHADTMKALSGSNNTAQAAQHITNNYTINATAQVGMYAGMPIEKRAIAEDLWRELVRSAKAQGVILPSIGSVVLQ